MMVEAGNVTNILLISDESEKQRKQKFMPSSINDASSLEPNKKHCSALPCPWANQYHLKMLEQQIGWHMLFPEVVLKISAVQHTVCDGQMDWLSSTDL